MLSELGIFFVSWPFRTPVTRAGEKTKKTLLLRTLQEFFKRQKDHLNC